MQSTQNNNLKMSIPKYLHKGDKVAVLCPASYINQDLSTAYDVLKDWGLQPIIFQSVTTQVNQFAGDDELRTKDLQQALDDPEIKAIIAGRGGYGCVRIIDNLNFDLFKKYPKWIVGFSDITVLHSHILQTLNIATIHGQMIKSFLDATPKSLETLHDALFGKNINIEYTYSEYPNREGKAQGVLTGGNLAILQSIIGSITDVDYTDKILFIEDVGESFYNIDRLLWTLKRANKLAKLKGLIVGGFTELKDSDPSFGYRYEEIIMDRVSDYSFPVAFGFPAGHIQNNLALVFGANVELKIQGDYIQLKYI